jgi:Exodeoxyribonuclease I subunit C (EC 3.1.11.1)
MKTFYWHDYETWGATPSVDRPSQFAGVRTDEELNILGEPLMIYCRPPEDIWPQPMACMVTGISPQKALAEGLIEAEFIARIHAELAVPQTSGVGYNSIRFDDEVTRYTLYRNFFDPYEREWRNGNGRWDIIDMVRLTYALRPSGIEWPMVEGKPSFKLENLTQANGISHAAAHDAYSDVAATIALAKLIKTKQPELYKYVESNRSKQKVAAMIDLKHRKPLLHISSRFSADHGCAALVVPLTMHPTNKNAVVVYDLSVDPTPLLQLDAEAIKARVFVANSDLPEGQARIPLKLVHLNKCPVLATTKLLDGKAAKRLNIDKALCEQHWQQLANADLTAKLHQLYSSSEFAERLDPEQKLYDGFISDRDKLVAAQLREASPAALAETNFVFDDTRLNAMTLRYKARNFPGALSSVECKQWQEFVAFRLRDGGEGCLSYDEYQQELSALRNSYSADAIENTEKLRLLDALADYGESKMAAISSYLR